MLLRRARGPVVDSLRFATLLLVAAGATPSWSQVIVPPIEPVTPAPVLVWDLGGKGKLAFYTMVEASFIKELIS